MADFPITGIGYSYRGRDEHKRHLVAEKNRIVQKIAYYVNIQVANNPKPVQQFSFRMIALDLGCDDEIVRHALSNGGYNGITYNVTSEDRELLAPFVAK